MTLLISGSIALYVIAWFAVARWIYQGWDFRLDGPESDRLWVTLVVPTIWPLALVVVVGVWVFKIMLVYPFKALVMNDWSGLHSAYRAFRKKPDQAKIEAMEAELTEPLPLEKGTE